jgi:hypothetical protein
MVFDHQIEQDRSFPDQSFVDVFAIEGLEWDKQATF